MKVIFKFSVVILVNLLINSCIQEQRVYPKQPAQGTTNSSNSTGNTNSSNSNSNNSSTSGNSSTGNSTTSTINYVSVYNYSYTEATDSNSNQYYSSFKLDFSFRTLMGSKIKYSVYATTFSSSNSNNTYALLYESPFIDNNKNDVVSFSMKINADSIFNNPIIKTYLSFNYYQPNTSQANIYYFFVVQDSLNNYYNFYSSSNYTTPTYSTQPNYLSITNYNFYRMETSAKDLMYSISNYYSPVVSNTLDNNSNGVIQQPTKFTTYFYTSVKNKSAYYKVYYAPNSSSNFLLYGTTTSYNLTSSNYSGTVIDVGTPLATLTTGGYLFKFEAFDSRTNEFLLSNTMYNSVFVESLTDDQRTFSIGYIKLIKNEDNDGDGYPSTYNLKMKLNSSDNVFPSTSTLNVNIANYGATYYQTMLSRSNLAYNDTITVLISGGTGYAKSYYDFEVNVRVNNVNIVNATASSNTNLREIKLERTTED